MSTFFLVFFFLSHPFILAGDEDMHEISNEFEFRQFEPLATDFSAFEHLIKFP